MKKKLSFLCAIFMMLLMLVISPRQAFALEVEAIEDTETIEEEIGLEEETEAALEETETIEEETGAALEETETEVSEEECEDRDVYDLGYIKLYNVGEPAIGEALDLTYFKGKYGYYDDNGHYTSVEQVSTKITWIHFVNGSRTGMASGDVFKEDEKYGCIISINILDNGVVFPSKTIVDENGDSSKIYDGGLIIDYIDQDNEIALVENNGKRLNIYYCWNKKPYKLIRNIEITGIDAPVVGEQSNKNRAIVKPDGLEVSLIWYKGNDWDQEEQFAFDGIFKGGYYYSCSIKVEAPENAFFPVCYDEDDDYIYTGSVYVNGKKANGDHYVWPDRRTMFIVENYGFLKEVSNAPQIASVKLSETSYEYDGTAKTPKVIVKDTDGKTVSTDYYTVKRSSGRKEVGTYTYKVVFNAPISKTYTLTFKILPAKVATVKTENTSSGIKVSWSAAAGATRYLVYRRDDGGSYVKVNSTTSRSFTDTAANVNGRKYDYRIYSYKLVDGVAYKGAGSSTKTYYYIKRPAITSFTSSVATRGDVKWSANTKATGYQIQYCLKSDYSSGAKTVTVSSASTVAKTLTGLTSGKRYYVRMRAYKTVGSAKYYSAWTGSKYVTVK